MNTLLVQLPHSPASPASTYSYAISSDGQTVASSASSHAGTLPATTGGGSEIVAIVPAQMLSWHRVHLPKGSAAGKAGSPRLRAVLDGLLEEQLLDDPSTLHFALSPGYKSGGDAWVAVCSRAWLTGHLQALESAGRAASRVIPEFSPTAQDEQPGSSPIYVIGNPDEPNIVWPGPQGVQTIPLEARTLLGSALVDETPVFAEPAVAQNAEAAIGRPVQVQKPSERWIDASRTEWNLSQFELATSVNGRRMRRMSGGMRDFLYSSQWRAARNGVVILVLVNLVGLNALAWRQESSIQAKEAEVKGLLTRTFPNVRVVVDAPVQLARELALLRQATGATSTGDLETMMTALGTALPNPTISSIEYANGEARLRGVDAQTAFTPALIDSMRTLGYALRMDNDVLVVTLAQGGRP